MEEFKAKFFERNELEYQEKSTLIALLPFLSNQNSNSDVGKNLKKFSETRICFKKRYPLTLLWKNEPVEMKQLSLNTEACQD